MSKKVLNLAVEISNTRDSEVPVKLLKVAGNTSMISKYFMP